MVLNKLQISKEEIDFAIQSGELQYYQSKSGNEKLTIQFV